MSESLLAADGAKASAGETAPVETDGEASKTNELKRPVLKKGLSLLGDD